MAQHGAQHPLPCTYAGSGANDRHSHTLGSGLACMQPLPSSHLQKQGAVDTSNLCAGSVTRDLGMYLSISSSSRQSRQSRQRRERQQQ